MYPGKEQVAHTTSQVQPLAAHLAQAGYRTLRHRRLVRGIFQMMPLGHQDISVSSFDSFQIYMSQAVIMAHFIVPLYFDHDLGFLVFPEIESFAQFVTPEVVTKRVETQLAEAAASGQPFFHMFFIPVTISPIARWSPTTACLRIPPMREKQNIGGLRYR